MQDNTPINNLDLCAKLQQKKNAVRTILKEMGLLKNGEVNDYDNYQYFSEAQYKELFTKLFSENGIELFVDEIDYGTFEGTDKQPFGRTVTLACTLIDIDTGYSESSRHTGEGLDRGDKAGYKATTGALKRFLSSTFLVATQDDPEREDDKTPKKTPSYSKKNSQPINSKKGTITPGQKATIKSLYKDDINQLKDVLKNTYKVTKVDELSMEKASQLIKRKKRGKEMKDLIKVVNDEPILAERMVQDLISVENKIKELKEIQDKYKKLIKEAMEKNGVIKLTDEVSGLTISYIAAQNNLEKFNKEKFQEENPDIYDKYVTMDGKKSAYITVRVK